MMFCTQLHMSTQGLNTDYPTNIAQVARQRTAGGQPPNGSQLTLIHWVAPRWAARWAAGGPSEAGHL